MKSVCTWVLHRAYIQRFLSHPAQASDELSCGSLTCAHAVIDIALFCLCGTDRRQMTPRRNAANYVTLVTMYALLVCACPVLDAACRLPLQLAGFCWRCARCDTKTYNMFAACPLPSNAQCSLAPAVGRHMAIAVRRFLPCPCEAVMSAVLILRSLCAGKRWTWPGTYT